MTYLKNNPYSTFIKLQFDDMDITYYPQENVMEMTVTRSSSLSYSVNITLYDHKAFEMERLILRTYKSMNEFSKANIFMQYGISNQNESPVMRLMLMDYEMEFVAGRSTLTLSLITQGFSSFGIPRRGVYSGSTSDVVKQIAKVEGWKLGIIEETIPIKDSKGKVKTYVQENMPSFRFIKEKLVVDSISIDTKSSNFNVYFSEINGETRINFCEDMYKNKPNSVFFFDVYHPDNSNVLSFSCKPTNLAMQLVEGAKMVGYGFDPITREHYTVEYDYLTNTSKVVVGPKSGMGDSTQYYQLGNVTKEQGQRIVTCDWYKAFGAVYSGTLEIIGNPVIQPQDTISIVVYAYDGKPHHTSGLYLIQNVTDTISGGSFTTSLEIRRNAGNIGDANSIGRRNY